jgi:hypothetical protein
MQVKLTLAIPARALIRARIVAVNAASAGRPVQFREKEAAKRHQISQTQAEDKGIKKKLHEAGHTEKKRSDEVEKEITRSK